MENEEMKQAREAVLTIDKFIQKYLYSLHPKTTDKWNDTKMEIDKIVKQNVGKSVYGHWE